MVSESGIANSFRAVKGDIVKLQAELINIQAQIASLALNIEKIRKPAKKKTAKKK